MSDSSSRLFFTGNTLDQAVLAAASHYDLDPGELAYERVERRTGFLRGSRRVVIRVDSDNPRQVEARAESPPVVEEAASATVSESGEAPGDSVAGSDAEDETVSEATSVEPSEAPEAAAREASPEVEPETVVEQMEPPPRSEGRRHSTAAETDIADLPRAAPHAVEAVQRGVDLLAALGDLELTAEVYEGEDQLVVEIGGEDQKRVVRGEGRLLLAIQHLLPRVLHGVTGEMTPCRVDSGGFRQRRVVALESVAHEAAEEVRRDGRAMTLASMNPADRRTIHLALEGDADVTTESDGHGFFKRVTVRPV